MSLSLRSVRGFHGPDTRQVKIVAGKFLFHSLGSRSPRQGRRNKLLGLSRIPVSLERLRAPTGRITQGYNNYSIADRREIAKGVSSSIATYTRQFPGPIQSPLHDFGVFEPSLGTAGQVGHVLPRPITGLMMFSDETGLGISPFPLKLHWSSEGRRCANGPGVPAGSRERVVAH